MITAAWISYVAVVGVTCVAGVIDLRTGLIPNRLTYPAVLFGLLFWPVVGGITQGGGGAWEMSQQAWLGMLAGLIPYTVLVLTAGLGMGDAKLMAAVGAITASWQVVLSVTVYALVVACVMAVVVMIRQGVVKQTLGRVFSAALLISHRVKPEMGRNGPTVAFAVAIAAGTIIAGAEQLLDFPTPWRTFSP